MEQLEEINKVEVTEKKQELPPAMRERMFKKGQSGNPSGRPKGDPQVKAVFKAHTLEAAQTIIKLMRSRNDKVALQAAQEVLNRVEGKPVQQQAIQVSGTLDMRSQIRAVLLERLNDQGYAREAIEEAVLVEELNGNSDNGEHRPALNS